MDVSNKVLQKLSKENIEPRSSWYFRIKDFLAYICAFVGIAIIGLTLGLILLNALEAGMLLGTIFLPIFVLIIFAIFISIILFQKSAGSDYLYKYSRFKLGSLLILLILSSFLVLNGIGSVKATDIALQHSKEYCHTMKKAVYLQWSSPVTGYIAGEIKEKPVSPRTFILKDLRRELWEIRPTDNLDIEYLNVEDKVKLRGEVVMPSVFITNEIHMWEGPMWFDILD